MDSYGCIKIHMRKQTPLTSASDRYQAEQEDRDCRCSANYCLKIPKALLESFSTRSLVYTRKNVGPRAGGLRNTFEEPYARCLLPHTFDCDSTESRRLLAALVRSLASGWAH